MTEAIVGREAELETAEQFLDRIPAGRSALFIEGTPGIGKTTLWRETVRRAGARGYRVLTTRPAEAEAKLSYSGLADLIGDLEPALFEHLPTPQRDAIDVALARVSGEADRRTLFAGFISLLAALAWTRPVVLAIDDLQWLDAPSMAALEFAIRRLAGSPIGVVVAVRLADQVRPRSFEQALENSVTNHLRLGPLSIGALHHLIMARLGRSLARPTLVRIEQTSGGNPFFALEIARRLLETAEPAAGQPLPVPNDLEDVVRSRIRRLPSATRKALLSVASLAQPTVGLVDRAALSAAEAADLVRVSDDGRVSFLHPLYASAVYGAATSDGRRAEHRRLADLVPDPEERARHLALAANGPDERVAAALSTAAAKAAARGATDAAAELGGLALELTPEPAADDRTRRRIAMGAWLLASGDADRAGKELDLAVALAPSAELRCDALLALTEARWDQDRRAAVKAAERAIAEAANPQQLGSAHALIAWAWGDLDLERAVEHGRAALRVLDRKVDPLLYASASSRLIWQELLLGLGADQEAYDRAIALAARRRTQERPSSMPAWLAMILASWMGARDDLAGARAHWEVLIQQAGESGGENELSHRMAMRAQVDLWRGDWPAAGRAADQAVEIADLTNGPMTLNHALFVRAFVDVHRGDLERGREACHAVLYLAEAERDPWFECAASSVLGFAELSAGDYLAAATAFARAEQAADAMSLREPVRFRFQGDQVEAIVALGDLEQAQRRVERLEDRGRVFPRPWTLAVGARCRGLVQAARGDLAAAMASLDRSLVHHAQLEMPFELARTLLVKGEVHRRRREKRLARESIEAARDIFESLGAPRWIGRANGELARVTARRTPTELTPTEREVAQLAASGSTNRQIAGALFMSPKTVEKRLASVYVKLGIRTRAELGGQMAEREVPAKT
jgi:DNA-binding CsgD family transcriptional regulator